MHMKLAFSVLCFFAAAGFAAMAQHGQEPDKSDLHKRAVAESLIPIRPGIPGKTPFWNEYSREFIYAPAFNFPKSASAASYRFTAVARDGVHSFEADVPWAPLSSIWAALPDGKVTLTVNALDERGGKVIGRAGTRTFYRSPVFNGPYRDPAVPYRESARLALASLFQKPVIQSWIRDGKPDPSYNLNCYPAKVMGATVLGMTLYSRLETQDEISEKALTAAKRAADFLMQLSEPSGAPLEYFPPTYWDGVDRGKHPVHTDRTMMPYPADAALAYLDLYDRTHDQKYFQAARRIADTYRKTQRADGVWPLLVKVKTGEAIGSNLLVPTLPIMLMDRLVNQYQLTEYQPVSERAFQWTMDNPVRKFNWDAQFEDVQPGEPYVNLAREQACDVAVRLLKNSPKDAKSIALAEELIHFAEDQFVVWEPPRPEWKEIVYLGCNPGGDMSPWITPVVLEQYRCYGPVARSMGIMITAWQEASRVTRNPLYLAKAKSLANSLTVAQQFWGGGEYPTWVRKTEGPIWLNNTVHTARMVLNFAEAIGSR